MTKLTAPTDGHKDIDMGLFSRKKSSEHAISEVNGTLNSDHDNSAVKDQFVSARASNASSEGSLSPESKKKKSVYQRYQDLKRGPGTAGLSDEDFEKATGMTRTEHAKWAQTANGVAGNQAAGSITAGGTNGFGLSAAGEGLGGWGPDAGKDPVVR